MPIQFLFFVSAFITTQSRVNSARWQKRCHDCRLPDVSVYSMDCGYLNECQRECETLFQCIAVHFRTGPNVGTCELVLSQTSSVAFQPSYRYVESIHWDLYERVRYGMRNVAWRPFCTNCIYQHPYPQHEIQKEVVQLDLTACKQRAEETSAVVVEFEEKGGVNLCTIKWGGNMWGLAGAHTAVYVPNVKTFILTDPNYLGCYRDTPKDPAMTFVGRMTQFDCETTCRTSGFSFYGLQGAMRCSCAISDRYAAHGEWNTFDSAESRWGCNVDFKMDRLDPLWESPEMAVFDYETGEPFHWWRMHRHLLYHGYRVNAVFRVTDQTPFKWTFICHQCRIKDATNIQKGFNLSLQSCKMECEIQPACYAILVEPSKSVCQLILHNDGMARSSNTFIWEVVFQSRFDLHTFTVDK